MPRRSSVHIERVTSPCSSRRATTRLSALCERWTASASSWMRWVSFLDVASWSSTSNSLTPRPCSCSRACSSAQLTRAWRSSSSRHSFSSFVSSSVGLMVRRLYRTHCIFCVHIFCRCISCSCMYYGAHDFAHLPPHLRRRHVGRPHLGRPVCRVRRTVPGRARRLDGRRRASLDPRGPRHLHLAAPVGGQRLRARLRRSAAARRARGGPARAQARLPDGGH